MQPPCQKLIAPDLIDSVLKLHLVLLFSRHPQLCGTATQLNEWFHVSPWAIAEALEALVSAGFVTRIDDQHGRRYRRAVRPEYQPLVQQLLICYDDPQQRDVIHTLVHAADEERQFRMCQTGEARAIGAAERPVGWSVVR